MKLQTMICLCLLTTGLAVPLAWAEDETASGVINDAEITSWRDRYLELGQEVYQWACAACHDEGVHGAPVMGDRDAWANRSELWSAVLLEHAKLGYLEMPAKGGHPYLSDRAVEAAGEYMLLTTFPELPRD